MKTLHRIALTSLIALSLTNCDKATSSKVQGYVEGEYVYVASPYAGELQKLAVSRGAEVKKGDPLFTLENTTEKAARDEALKRLAQAQANLEDIRKGKRPTEIASLEAQVAQAKSALDLSRKTLARQQELTSGGAGSIDDLDRARSTNDQNEQRLAQLDADLKTARLGARADQISSAEAEVHAREALLEKTEWDLKQKAQKATQDGLVFDTLYREGEWVAAGKPVVVVLPPTNIKVRTFIPQQRISTLHQGDAMKITVDGIDTPFIGKVSFISPQAEYTPPVIYSKENREKLVFMMEIVFDPASAAKLHPGQPVDVEPGS
jgi:HlyD family secretion protein